MQALKHSCSRKKSVLMMAALFALLLIIGCSGKISDGPMPIVQPYTITETARLRATLYFSNNQGELVQEVRQVELTGKRSTPETVIGELMLGSRNHLNPVISRDAVLNFVYLMGDTAIIEVSAKENLDEYLILFRKACAMTLQDMFGINNVSVTVDGVVPKVFSEPVYVHTKQNESASTYLMLYYPDVEGKYIVPLVRARSGLSKAELPAVVFNALGSDLGNAWAGAVLNDAKRLTLGKTLINKNVLSVYLQAEEETSLTLMGNAALAKSLLMNMPGVEGVKIFINRQQVVDVPGISDEGVFTPKSLQSVLGGYANVYYAASDAEKLTLVRRGLPIEQAGDPLVAVRSFIKGPMPGDTGLMSVVPSEIQQRDVVSIVQNGNLAVVNVTESFKEKCNDLSSRNEYLLVYAIVNTVTERPDIERVLFVCEDEPIMTLNGEIMLAQPLLRNPGIIE